MVISVALRSIALAQSVGIGTVSADASAKLDISSTNSGLLPPRMSATERNLIPSPAAGLIIYNTTSNAIEFYNGTSWYNISNAIASQISNSIFASTPLNKLIGGYSSEKINSINKTSDGGYILAGHSNSSNTGSLSGITSNGGFDFWILKLDGAGNVQWQKLLGGSGLDEAATIEQTADGGFIVAGLSTSSNTGTLTGLISNGGYDSWILKLDATGNVQWQKLLGGGAFEYANHVQQTADGGYMVCGNSGSSNAGTLTGVTGNGLSDGWLIKLDAAGNLQWQKLLGGSTYDAFMSFQQTSDGGYIVAGISGSSNTGTLTGITMNGEYDSWIIKLDGTGTMQWQKLLGGTKYEIAHSILQTTDGGYIVAGFSSSSNTGTLVGFINHGLSDYWILKLTSAGVIQWQQLLGGNQEEEAYSILQTTDGGYFVTGTSNSADIGGGLAGIVSNGEIDYWVVKLSGTGFQQWQKLLGGSKTDVSAGSVQNADGSFVVAGNSNSTGSGILAGKTGNGLDDCWVIKLDKFGNPL